MAREMYGLQPTLQEIIDIDLDTLPDNLLKWYVYWRGFYDMTFYTDYFLGHYKVDKKTGEPIPDAQFHIEFRKAMKSQEDVVCIVPRDHAKSTNSFFDDMHDICYEIEPHILLIMSANLGVASIGKIRDECETNERIHDVFGRLVPLKTKAEANKKWTRKLLEFTNGCKIETVTTGGKIRGGRPTKIKVDDPQEDDDVTTKEKTDKFNRWFWGSVYTMLDPNGRCIVIGTVIGPMCLVSHISEGDRGFKVIKYAAIKDAVIQEGEDGKEHIVSGTPLRPEKWSLEALDDRMRKITKPIFMQEYMNVPNMVWGDLVFNMKMPKILTDYTMDDQFKDLWIYKKPYIEQGGQKLYARGLICGVDTAKGGETGDYSAISLRDRDGKLYAFYYGRSKPDVLCKVINRIFELGYTPLVAIENNNTGLVTVKEAQSYIWDRFLYITKTIDKISQHSQKEYGWNTNTKTRPLAIGEYELAFRNGELEEVDIRLYREMETFAYDENRKPVAIKPYHDDGIMADAIGWQMRKEPIMV